MKKIYVFLSMLLLAMTVAAQTLNVTVGNVTYKFPVSQAGEMVYTNGTTLTIKNKPFVISDISSMALDSSSVTDNTVCVTYNGDSTVVIVAGNIAQYIVPTVVNGHVNITQSEDLADEITYKLSGTSNDGEFYMSGSYKATIELNGLSLTNGTPVTSGAAIHIQNSKRIKIKIAAGTTNTLVDATGGSQKGCLYIKGHAEFSQKGTLNVTGNVKHGIKTDEYFTIKDATINVQSAAGDGINCSQYFLMESGEININGTGDDGIQCDIDGDSTTGETTDHEDEDSGNIYISDGTININATATAAKGMKCEGDMQISGGTIGVKTTGNGEWDSEDVETKAACGLSCDSNMTISGGKLTLTSTGSGGKGMKCDGILTISDGNIDVVTSGGLYFNNGTTENTNYSGDTENVNSNYYSSPKGIKAGVKTESSTNSGKTTYTYSGGINIKGGTINVTTSGRNAEGIESKNFLNIDGGNITINAYDDAVNSGQDLTISGGYVYARSTNNDGIDANGNCYIKGGVVYAIGTNSPEVAIDVNSEEQKQLYFTGGTLVAVGGLESGASLSQKCYSSSWAKNTWYALYSGDSLTLAFKTPSAGGTPLVVSTPGTTALKSGVSISSGTEYFGGMGNIGGTASGGSAVTLAEYIAGNNQGGGNRPGGGGHGGR